MFIRSKLKFPKLRKKNLFAKMTKYFLKARKEIVWKKNNMKILVALY